MALVRYAQKASNVYDHYQRRNYAGVMNELSSLVEKKPPHKAKAVASKVLAKTPLKKYLDTHYERKCGIEVKRYELAGTNTLGTTLVTLSAPLNSIPGDLIVAQGLTDGTRIGNTIEVHSLKCRFTALINPAAIASTRVRMFAIKLGASAGSYPNAASILQTTNNLRSTKLPADERNIAFSIMEEWDFTLTLPAAGRDRHDFVWNYYPKGCHKIVWTQGDTTGAAVNFLEGEIVFYAMYEGGGSAPTLAAYTEFDWVDP